MKGLGGVGGSSEHGWVLVTVINKVIVAGFFGNWGRGLGNLDVF